MNALLTEVLAADSKPAAGNAVATILMYVVLLGGVFYFMTSSSRKQKRKQADLMSSLKAGDEVVTSGGIHGVVNFIEDAIVHVAVDTDVVIRVSKSAITRIESPIDDEVVADVTDSDDTGDEAAAKPGRRSKPSKSS